MGTKLHGTYREMDKCLIPFEPCTGMAVIGASGSGKTWWIRKLITQLPRVYQDPVPQKVMYCFGIDQPLYHEMASELPYITFHKGLPSEDTIEALDNHYLIVIDDLSSDVLKSNTMQDLFVKGCHHQKLSVIFVLHNLYEKGKNARTIALNCQYLVLFKNARDVSQIYTLGRQMYPRRSYRLVEAYDDATRDPRGYLVIDNTATIQDNYRLRSKVFADEYPVVYLPKSQG